MKRKAPTYPPRLADWLLTKLLGENLHEELQGDLLELFEDRSTRKGWMYAALMYWIEVIHLSAGFFQKKPKPISSRSMVKHYFVISVRNLSRNRGYAAINIIGLAVGMGICIAISQYIFYELRHDDDLTHNPNIYRLTLERSSEGSLVDRDLYTAHALGTIAKEKIPEVKAFTRLYVPDEGAFISGTGQRPLSVTASEMYYVDRNFLTFFEFELIAGDPKHALDDLFSVVISESMAEKHFGDKNPLGKILTIGGGASHGDYQVTGVIPDRPTKSHLQFDFLFPILNFIEYGWLGAVKRNPHIPWFVTYFELNSTTEVAHVQRQLDRMIDNHKAIWNPELPLTERTLLQEISAIHFDPDRYANADYVTNKGNKSDIESFLVVAVFILIIAWCNYINLSTAQSMKRAKEVGIRKSVGAQKGQLMYQFLSEAFTINLFAAILSLGIGYLSLNLLGEVLGKELSYTLLANGYFWYSFVFIVCLGSLLSGAYPAFLLSGFKPLHMLSNRIVPNAPNFNFRKVLVTFQFLVSLLLLSGTYLVYKQITFMQNEDLGMDMDQILVVKGPMHIEVLDGGPQLTNYEGLQAFNEYSRKTFDVFRNEVHKIPAIRSVTGSWNVPGDIHFNLEDDIRRWGAPENENKTVKIVEAGLDFIKTYDLELIAGKAFTPDLVESRAVILNEMAVHTFGFTSAEEAVGDRLYFGEPLEIVGVVKNYHWHSLKEDYAPWIIWFGGSTPGYFSIKLNTIQMQETIPQIEKIYDRLYPGNPFEYFFIDDQFNNQYQADLQFGKLFLLLTLLAVLISCIGLFALISYSATRRVKEIGIRKVLGASISQLMLLLSKDYFRLLAFSILLAAPLVFYFGGEWLDHYAFRINLGLDIFIVPGFLLVLIAFFTVGHRTLSSARANPIDSLRSE